MTVDCPAILLIIFKRPDTTAQVMEAIREAKPTKLYIAADGPRANHQGDAAACQAAREIALNVDWPCQVNTLFREVNLGCRKGVSSAIDWFFEQEVEGIILEDDVVPTESFFQFCAELLVRYRDDMRIGMISGNNFSKRSPAHVTSYLFSRLTHVWGWATWRRAWANYDRNMDLWKPFIERQGFQRLGLGKEFVDHYAPNFHDAYLNNNDSWAYVWMFSMLANNMLGINPGWNLSSNIGFSINATHTVDSLSRFFDLKSFEMEFPLRHEQLCIADHEADLLTVRQLESPLTRRLSALFRSRSKSYSRLPTHVSSIILAEIIDCPAVLLIIFKRADVTAKVMEAIRQAKPPKLYIAADGPRSSNQGEAEECEAARQIALNVDWTCEVFTLFRDTNLGCGTAVSTAIDWFFVNESEGIILEDDVVPVKSFFKFCAELLVRYRDDARIGMISGNNFRKRTVKGDFSYSFSRLTHIWGWATWRRAWKNYDRTADTFKAFVELDGFRRLGLGSEFIRYLSENIESAKTKKVDAWDFQWTFSCLKNNTMSIIPCVNLVTNIGFGDSATHTTDLDSQLANMLTSEILFPLDHPLMFLPDNKSDLETIRFAQERFFPSVIAGKLKALVGRS